MRITKQPSGGRGEYEVADYAPSGHRPDDLLDLPIHLRLGSYVINTRVRPTKQGNKNRLRLEDKPALYPHVQLQVANALLLPKPRRDEKKLGDGEPVLHNETYIVKNINLDDVDIVSGSHVEARVITVDAANRSISAEEIPVGQRMAQIEAVWGRLDAFPEDIAALLRQHRAYVQSGDPLPHAATGLVHVLQNRMEQYCAELEIAYNRTTDVVPALLSVIGEVILQSPTPLAQIPTEDVEVRKAERKKWLQYSARRGAASVRFRKEVRNAYKCQCVMCGAHFPPTEYNSNPGIDSAHILPWSEADLDEIYNGVALCKLHHWAFDEGLLRLVHNRAEDAYYVELSAEAERGLTISAFSLDVLRQAVGKVPNHRLPTQPRERPRPQLLDLRYSEEE